MELICDQYLQVGYPTFDKLHAELLLWARIIDIYGIYCDSDIIDIGDIGVTFVTIVVNNGSRIGARIMA